MPGIYGKSEDLVLRKESSAEHTIVVMENSCRNYLELEGTGILEEDKLPDYSDEIKCYKTTPGDVIQW